VLRLNGGSQEDFITCNIIRESIVFLLGNTTCYKTDSHIGRYPFLEAIIQQSVIDQIAQMWKQYNTILSKTEEMK
jgi:hypothetical protein